VFNQTPSPMKTSTILTFAFLAMAAWSCKKNTEELVQSGYVDYYQLKVGNYWIYEGFTIDSTGVATSTGKFDSAYIEKDTIIRGYTFYKLYERPFAYLLTSELSLVRDSSGYLVNNYGKILSSNNDFSNVLFTDTSNSILYIGYLKMTGKDSVVSCPSGDYQTITSRLKVVPTQPNDTHPIRYSYSVYARSIGKIKSHGFFYSGYKTMESRLLRYHVVTQ